MSRITWLTADILQAATGAPASLAETWFPHLLQTCEVWDIDTPERVAAFLANLGHESGGFRHLVEIWGPSEAQKRYEGRKDLGNTQHGDGEKFKGHGLIQITGRANHAAAREGLRERLLDPPDFESFPEQLATAPWAALSAGWFWHANKINQYADAGDFDGVCDKINRGRKTAALGDANGYADRHRRWEAAKAAIAGVVMVPKPATYGRVFNRPSVVLEQPPPQPTFEPAAPAPAESPARAAAPTRPIPAEEGVNMSPFIAAALPAIIDAVPKLGQIFSSGSQVAERNVKAVETVVKVAKDAIGAANEQELVERLQADPGAASAVRNAVQANWFEIQQQAEKSIAAARDFATAYAAQKDVRTVLGNLTFQELLTLLFIVISAIGAGIVLTQDGYSAEIKGSIITLMLIAGYTGVREFWFGSSPVEQAKAKQAP